MSDPALESHTRSLLKGLTHRFVATLTTIAIAWAITGDVAAALQIGFIEVFAKIAIYYLHERVWAHIRIGASTASGGEPRVARIDPLGPNGAS